MDKALGGNGIMGLLGYGVKGLRIRGLRGYGVTGLGP